MISVALCAFMMVVSTSVMDGFLSKIELAAKGLFGDVVIDGKSLDGLPYYDEFIAEIKRQLPDMIEDASPFILTYGIMEAPFVDENNRQNVQIAGIRMPERTRVSTFGAGLTYQAGVANPTFDPPIELLLENVRQQIAQTDRLAQKAARDKGLAGQLEAAWKKLSPEQRDRYESNWGRVSSRQHERLGMSWRKLPPDQRDRLEAVNAIAMYGLYRSTVASPDTLLDQQLIRLWSAAFAQRDMEAILFNAQPHQAKLAELERKLQQADDDETASGEDDDPFNTATVTVSAELREQLNRLAEQAGSDRYANGTWFPFQPPGKRAIVGLGIPWFMFRTGDGTVVRTAGPGNDIVLTLIPMGKASLTGESYKPLRETFTIIDESRTDVSQVDSNTVYLPFETLQAINRMGPDYDLDTGKTIPARTTQIHVKVRPEFVERRERANNRLAVRLGLSPRQPDPLTEVAENIERVGASFKADPRYASAFFSTSIHASSWRVRQGAMVGQIESQRTLVVIMFGIISLVSVVLIFVIFYMIVLQKTKDIGVIKSLGGSSWGVATIFLGYGGATGLVGAVLGIFGGWQFMRNINDIHNWVGRTFGFQVWNREWFMFDQIPNEVEVSTLLSVAIGAILAGLLGSLVPAIIASHMQPVRALRYE